MWSYKQTHFWPTLVRAPADAQRGGSKGMCFWSYVNAPISTPPRRFGSFFLSFCFHLTHSVSLLLDSPQPHVLIAPSRSTSPCLADAESPQLGAGGVHRALPGCGAASFGDHVRLDFIFGPPSFSKVGLGHGRFLWSLLISFDALSPERTWVCFKNVITALKSLFKAFLQVEWGFSACLFGFLLASTVLNVLSTICVFVFLPFYLSFLAKSFA